MGNRQRANKRQSSSTFAVQPGTIFVAEVDYANVAFYWELSPSPQKAEKIFTQMYEAGMKRAYVDLELEKV